MTVTNTNTQQSFTGDGVTTTFNFTFPIQLATDVQVYVNTVPQSTGYSITVTNPSAGPPLTGASGGSVVFSVAPIAGAVVLAVRSAPLTQATGFPYEAPFPAPALESCMDKLIMCVQQLSAKIAKCFQLPATDTSGASTTTPVPVANDIFQWDVNGTAIQFVSPLVAFSNAGGAGGNVVGPAGAPSKYAIPLYADTNGKLLTTGVAPAASGNFVLDNGPGNPFTSSAFPINSLPAGVLKIGGVSRGPGVTVGLRPLPNIPTGLAVANAGSAGVTTYTYKVVVMDTTGVVASGVPTAASTCSAGSAAASTTTGNATVNGTNYNVVTCNASSVPSAIYLWYRTVGGTQQGYLGSTTVPTFNDQSMTVVTNAAVAPTSAQWVGEFWHTGNFTTDSPVTHTRCRAYVDGNFAQQATHTFTASTELSGGAANNANTNTSTTSRGGNGSGLGGGTGGTNYTGTVITSGGGGGNGGAGGGGTYAGGTFTGDGPGGQAYAFEHSLLGSGGGGSAGNANGGSAGGAGGGCFLLQTSGTISIAANITATGGTGTNAPANTNNAAGGGGAGGSICLLSGSTITLTAVTLSVAGGAGGACSTGNGAGGGGGGGGKIIMRAAGAITDAATKTVTGGAAGASTGSAVAATAGASGTTDIVQNIGYSVRAVA